MGIDKIVSRDSLPWLATVVSGIGATFFHEGGGSSICFGLQVTSCDCDITPGARIRDNGGHYVHRYVVHKILLQRENILPCLLILILWKAYDTHFHRLYLTSHRISDDSESPSAAQTCLYYITVVLLIPDVEDPLADADPVMAYPEGP